MRRIVLASGLSVVGLVVGVVIATGYAQGADRPSDRPSGQHRTFTVVEHADTDTTTDTGKKGDSVGDVLTFANPIYDAADAHRIGSDNGSCIRTAAGKAYECTWTTTLAGGSLVVEGPFYDSGDSTLAITGGTGKYAKARGEMRLHFRNPEGTEFDFTFRLAGSH